MSYSKQVKERAHKIAPSAWCSYSGKTKEEKRFIEHQRTLSLELAFQECQNKNLPLYAEEETIK